MQGPIANSKARVCGLSVRNGRGPPKPRWARLGMVTTQGITRILLPPPSRRPPPHLYARAAGQFRHTQPLKPARRHRRLLPRTGWPISANRPRAQSTIRCSTSLMLIQATASGVNRRKLFQRPRRLAVTIQAPCRTGDRVLTGSASLPSLPDRVAALPPAGAGRSSATGTPGPGIPWPFMPDRRSVSWMPVSASATS